jgi:hypothetical protein
VGEFITHHASEIWSFIAGLVGGGAAGSLLTIRVQRSAIQKKVTARGDVVAGDKTTTTHRN